jgi:hypothetical protein
MEKNNFPEIKFCTECGDSLENFCFSAISKDINSVKDQLEECKKREKFNGEFCSKYFIAKEFEMIEPDDNEL